MAEILAIGVVTVDLVQVVDHYPDEDSEQRACEQFYWRGGNASNSLVVLSQLGHRCQLFATLADDKAALSICDDLQQHAVDYSICPVIKETISPTSHILINAQTGTRTIVHYRDLPELRDSDMSSLSVSKKDWLHIEGRNVAVTYSWLSQLHASADSLPIISLEIEKPREGIESLFPYADHLLFGRHYVEQLGYTDPVLFLREQAKSLLEKHLVCAWGSQGAYGMNEGKVFHVPALKLGDVIDSRAAGDVFNAAYIDAQIKGLSATDSLQQACQLAGRKCQQYGLSNLL